jgi:hypothetical protein
VTSTRHNTNRIIVLQKGLLSTSGKLHFNSAIAMYAAFEMLVRGFLGTYSLFGNVKIAPSVIGLYCRDKDASVALFWAIVVKRFDLFMLFIPILVTLFVYFRIKRTIKQSYVLSQETTLRVQNQISRRGFMVLGVYGVSYSVQYVIFH